MVELESKLNISRKFLKKTVCINGVNSVTFDRQIVVQKYLDILRDYQASLCEVRR